MTIVHRLLFTTLQIDINHPHPIYPIQNPKYYVFGNMFQSSFGLNSLKDIRCWPLNESTIKNTRMCRSLLQFLQSREISNANIRTFRLKAFLYAICTMRILQDFHISTNYFSIRETVLKVNKLFHVEGSEDVTLLKVEKLNILEFIFKLAIWWKF